MSSGFNTAMRAMGVDFEMLWDASFLYEIYKISWKKQHEITASDERELVKTWRRKHFGYGGSYTWGQNWYGNAMLEFGYGSKGSYVGFNEFCFNELCNREYMLGIIGDDSEVLEIYERVYAWMQQDD